MNFAMLIDCLEELADQSFQEEVWLGSRPDVLSFSSEAFEQTFTDTGLSSELEKDQEKSLLSPQVRELALQLERAVRKVPNSIAQKEIIVHPAMVSVRSLASALLRELKQAL